MFARSFIAAILVAAPVVAQDASTVVATVNDDQITLGQMLAMRQGLPPEMAGLPDQALWDLMLDQLIRQTAMAQEGEKTMTPRDEAALEIDRRAYLAGAALERIADAEPTDEEITAVYNSVFGGEPATEYDADHILLETEEAAKAVIEELAGGADFGTLAEERSTDQGSGANKGDLGWFTLDRMVPEFSQAVETMEPGQSSETPVQSQFGWHVIKLNETRVQTPPELSEIRDQLVQQVRRNKVEAEIARITEAASVEKTEGLAPALLSDDSILGGE